MKTDCTLLKLRNTFCTLLYNIVKHSRSYVKFIKCKINKINKIARKSFDPRPKMRH